MIEAQGVSVLRGGRLLLDGVSLRAAAGEILAVVGPSGAGKSTLLKVLCGDLAPAAGEALLDGRPVRSYRPLELARRRAVLPQESALSFPFRVEDVVALGRSPHPGPPGPGAARALEAVGLAALAGRLYPTLSGGERQRVQLARVLAQLDGPGRALLLDEPTASLDVGAREAVLAVVRRVAARGLAVVVVLHDLNLALAHADRVAVLRAGRLNAVGPSAETLTAARASEVFAAKLERIDRPGRPPVLVAVD